MELIAYHVKFNPLQLKEPVLKDDVYTSDARTLVARKGTELTTATVRRLTKFGACAPLQARRFVRQQFSNDNEFADSVMKTAHTIVEGALLGRCITQEQTDALFDMLFYSNPYNFERVANYIGEVEAVDSLTFDHSMRVAWLMIRIGMTLGCDGSQLKDLMQIGLLHDLGKTMIPIEILTSKNRLSKEEFAIIQRHAVYSHQLVRAVSAEGVAEAVLNHHERVDGSGYPNGLKKDELNLYSQLIGMVDVYEATKTLGTVQS